MEAVNPFKRVKPPISEKTLNIIRRWLSDDRFAHDISHRWRFIYATPEEVTVVCAALGVRTPLPKLYYEGYGKPAPKPRAAPGSSKGGIRRGVTGLKPNPAVQAA